MIFDEFAWPFPDPFPMTATAWRRTIVQFIRDNAIAFTVDKSWRHASLEFDHDRESPSMVEMLDGINPQTEGRNRQNKISRPWPGCRRGVDVGWSIAEYCGEHLQTIVHSEHPFSRWHPSLCEVVHARS